MAAGGVSDGWEYLILPENEASETRLSALGREGWEMVTGGSYAAEPVLYFKRRLLAFRETVTLDQRRVYYASLGRESVDAERLAR